MPDTTVYRQTDEDRNTWECAECQLLWSLMSGAPSENEMQYCPGCGREIVDEKAQAQANG